MKTTFTPKPNTYYWVNLIGDSLKFIVHVNHYGYVSCLCENFHAIDEFENWKEIKKPISFIQSVLCFIGKHNYKPSIKYDRINKKSYLFNICCHCNKEIKGVEI
jgi:hypothetical protein